MVMTVKLLYLLLRFKVKFETFLYILTILRTIIHTILLRNLRTIEYWILSNQNYISGALRPT